MKSKLYAFKMQRGCSVNEHLNRYTKLLIDLVNVDVETSEEDKAVIFLNSLPREEYETFILTFLNSRKSLNYSEVSAALVSYEARRQDTVSSSGNSTAEALAVRGRSSNRRGRDDQGRSKSRSGFRNLKKNLCALCKELGHWKAECPKTKGKKVESNTEANLAQANGSDDDSWVFSLSVTTPIVSYSNNAEWILDTGATYHV